MKITIGDKIERTNKNVFVLNHNYMIGDADGDYDFTNIISKEYYREVKELFDLARNSA